MLFKKKQPTYQGYPANDSTRTKKIVLIAVTLLTLTLLISLGLLSSNSKSRSGSISKGSNQYSNSKFSINLPDNFEAVSNSGGIVEFALKDGTKDTTTTGSISISKYLQNTNPDSILKDITDLSSKDAAGNALEGVSIEDTALNGDTTLLVKGPSFISYLVIKPDFVWKIEMRSEQKDAKLLTDSKAIALSFKVK